MMVKNDHRSNFFFQFKPLEGRSPDIFQASSFQLLKLEKIYCDDHSSPSVISCISFHPANKRFDYDSSFLKFIGKVAALMN